MKLFLKGLLFHFLFLFSFSVFAQSYYDAQVPKNVRIGLEITSKGFQPCEPSIAISQKNPKIIIAGSILDNVYRSTDGGHTWKQKTLESSLGVYGDPCVISSPNGDFYYLHLSDPEGKGWSSDMLLDRIVCQHSKNNGKKWSDGGSIGLEHPKDQDKEWAALHLKQMNSVRF